MKGIIPANQRTIKIVFEQLHWDEVSRLDPVSLLRENFDVFCGNTFYIYSIYADIPIWRMRALLCGYSTRFVTTYPVNSLYIYKN